MILLLGTLTPRSPFYIPPSPRLHILVAIPQLPNVRQQLPQIEIAPPKQLNRVRSGLNVPRARHKEVAGLKEQLYTWV